MGGHGANSDYMPREEFARRAREQITLCFKPMGQTLLITVSFENSFDEFAARVAYELRHYVVYRSDGGHFARGLVRATGDLAAIHHDRRSKNIPPGSKVRLLARLFRRQHTIPGDRWMMSVRFAEVEMSFNAAEEGVIHASDAITDQSKRGLAERVLEHAAVVVENKEWHGDRQKRLRDWVKLAEKLGYPRSLDLYYYNRVAVFEYVNWNTLDPRRIEMTRATGGRVPFDGTTGGMSGSGTFSAPPNTPWRNFPFQNAV